MHVLETVLKFIQLIQIRVEVGGKICSVALKETCEELFLKRLFHYVWFCLDFNA